MTTTFALQNQKRRATAWVMNAQVCLGLFLLPLEHPHSNSLGLRGTLQVASAHEGPSHHVINAGLIQQRGFRAHRCVFQLTMCCCLLMSPQTLSWGVVDDMIACRNRIVTSLA
jgi:hypothetical protein